MQLEHGQIKQVAEGIFVATPNPGEGTIGIVVMPQGKVAIDTSSYDRFARMVKNAVDMQYPGPWLFVITTHSHFDHVGGNECFPAPIIANSLTESRMRLFTPTWLSENLQSWIETGALDRHLLESPKIIMPSVIFEERITLRISDLSLEVHLLGGHSEDSSVVYIPERRTLFAADLVFNGKKAATGDADLRQWQRSLRQLQQLPLDVVVAGHGPPGGPELLDAQLDEIEALLIEEEVNAS